MCRCVPGVPLSCSYFLIGCLNRHMEYNDKYKGQSPSQYKDQYIYTPVLCPRIKCQSKILLVP